MRHVFAMLGALVVVGCGQGDVGAQDASSPGGDVVVARIEFPSPPKALPQEPDPADSAEDSASCSSAGGDWDDVYLYGTIGLREPREGAEWLGKRCWSRRQPTRLADAGKPCGGQSDCIGNCWSERAPSGQMTPPRCQTFVEDAACNRWIYDGGKHQMSIPCPVP